MKKPTHSPAVPAPTLSLKQTYQLLRRLPLGCKSDGELERISDHVSTLSGQQQIAALLARIDHR